jgi:hypothetical protein
MHPYPASVDYTDTMSLPTAELEAEGALYVGITTSAILYGQ